MPAQVGERDRVLVYFAGHGVAAEGADGPKGYLLLQDAKPEDKETFLAMQEVSHWLGALTCRHLLVILDCCFAGTFRWTSTRDVTRLPSVIYKEVYERFVREKAWQVLTSAAYDQKALDTVAGDVIGVREQEELPHSPFALALFEALEGKADVVPVDGGDGVITATELYLFLLGHVAAYHNQTPGLWSFRREYDKGEFVFLDPNRIAVLKSAPDLSEELNPWWGLQAYKYTEQDEEKKPFFGRTQAIDALAKQVKAHPFTAVLGASGTGKSSLVNAGLLPKLEGEKYHVFRPMRPTMAPLQALRQTLRHHLDGEQAEAISIDGLFARWREQHPDKTAVAGC